jgi:hypothetical protein
MTYYSIPGMAPSQPSEKARRLVLPDIHDEKHEAQLGEFLRSREGTPSHQTVGLERGEKVRFRDLDGTDRPAIVDHEEHDPHSGKTDVYLHANDQTGSGSYKVTFEGNGPRDMKSSRAKRIFE